MIAAKVYTASEINFTIDDVAAREEPRQVLMCSPEYFDIVDVKNVHMEGKIGALDKALAQQQWKALHDVYQNLALEGALEQVHIIKGVEGCEDMVFAANQSFPWMLDGERVVLMSKMRHESRQREVPHFQTFYEQQNYRILHLARTQLFEGMGDTIPHYGKNLLYGGYGHRSETVAYEEISALLQVPVVTLELIDERFYHLDTCFIPIDENTLLLCPDAFTEDGKSALKKLFKNIVEIQVEEAEQFFSLNAHCINDKNSGKKIAIIHPGSRVTKNALNQAGYTVIETDTSEYMKSGGSVFCMKMMMY